MGPFDERYPLYFEETDWLARARRRGLPARYVPSAQAVHLYGRSAAREPRARQWFEESARRFRRQHYGAWFEPLLRRLGGSGSAAEDPFPVISPRDGIDLTTFGDQFPLWIEVSPNPAGFPAAGEWMREPAGRWTLPEEIVARREGGDLAVRVVDRRGRELAGFSLRPEPSREITGEIS